MDLHEHFLPEKLKQLITLLSDGAFHSGESLGPLLGISRAGVWKIIQQLQDYDLPYLSLPKKGYALLEPLEWLERQKIEVHLDPEIAQLIQSWIIVDTIDSTSRTLMQPCIQEVTVCLSEHQSNGYGRRGRTWQSPLGYNLYLSISWQIEGDTHELSGLNIALGVALIKALQQLDSNLALGLKWPNDIFVQDQKLAGLMIETRSTSHDICHVVVSCGLNLLIPPHLKNSVSQSVIDLKTLLGTLPKRNAIAGLIINAILHTLKDWPGKLNKDILNEWARFDIFKQKDIWIEREKNAFKAIILGVDAKGRLRVQECNGPEHTLSSSDFSIKKWSE